MIYTCELTSPQIRIFEVSPRRVALCEIRMQGIRLFEISVDQTTVAIIHAAQIQFRKVLSWKIHPPHSHIS